MKRERTQTHDIIRQGSTISIVERRSGVAASFEVPCEEARAALVRILADPIEAEPAPAEDTPPEAVAESDPAPAAEPEKKTTRKRTKKESAT